MDDGLSIAIFEQYLLGVRSKNTTIKYVQAAERFLEYCHSAGLSFDKLPPGVMNGFSSWLSRSGAAPRSVHVYVAGARRYLDWCRGRGETIPALSRGDLPRIHNLGTPNALRDDVLMKYLSLANRLVEPARTCLLLLPYCGLRSEEMTTLSLRSIRKVGLQLRGGGTQDHIVFAVRGKGGDVRVVPLLLDGPPLLASYLQGWRRTAGDGDWLFPLRGGPIATRTVRYYVQKIREAIGPDGVKKLTPHTLRRTYLTTLWKAGLDVPTLTKIAGHKSVQTTMTHYLDIQPEDLASSIQRVGARLIQSESAAQSAASRVSGVLRSTAANRNGG